MNEIQLFKFENKHVRSLVKDDNSIWFIAKDVCNILDIANSRDAISRLDSDDKAVVNTDTLGGSQNLTIINESGLYSLVLTSRKKEAKIFKKWVTSEVLPTIRKTGSYQPVKTEEAMLLALFPKTDVNLITLTAHTIRDNKHKEILLLEQKPKIEFYEQVTSSKDAVDIGTVAKVLNIKNIGKIKLFEFLRTNKILDTKNRPYQKYIDSGWFRLIESSWTDKNGDSHINFKTVAYQKGIDAIRRLILKLPNLHTEFNQESSKELLAS